MGDIVYFVRGDKRNAYLNITPNYACTNDCVFCDKQVLESAVVANLRLEKEPSLDDVIRELHEKVDKNIIKEFVFCGIGEPLLYLDKVLDITKHIKNEYGKEVRVNTNGQAYLIHPDKNVVLLLEQAGVDSVSVSINSIDEESYRFLHKPKHHGAFEKIIDFVKDCNQSSIYTTVTFLEFPKLDTSKHELAGPEKQSFSDKKKVLEFTRKTGLRDEQVRFRRFLRK